MGKSRKRGVSLDKEKIRRHAKLLNAQTVYAFEMYYIRHFKIPETQETTIPKKAWNGIKMDKKSAMNIAEVFGLPDYFSLLPQQSSSPWTALVTNKTFHQSFMKLRLAGDADKNLIDTDAFHSSSEEPDKISIKENWFLQLSGKEGDCFMIILQSREMTFQLAPLEFEGFFSKISGRNKQLRYPSEKNFSFGKQYGVGWRCCTVIRSSFIPLPARSGETGFTLSPRELDECALRLTQNREPEIAIDSYEFMLVD